ncbi:hypothetical protein RhiirA5_432739 [Rhizophagus irregularis]|uniref:Uncharacterized protein n=1 Tax=Rhizophagus irregularis TaxID=588596 RepID=A0A2N0NSS5_9GLOM|nr:hypothetical protein RhiirA5_432739 [Rhizophagus irregularis]
MDIITSSNLQKCKKCRKILSLEAFFNENTYQFKLILEIDTNEYLENDLTGIDFNCNKIDMMDDNPKKLSKIIDLIGESDGYYYIYKDSYTSKKASDILTFRYKCSQCKSLAKRPRKNESIEKQRSTN